MKKYHFRIKKYHSGLTIRELLKGLGISERVIKDLTKKEGLILVDNKVRFINYTLQENELLEVIIEENEKNEIQPTNNFFEIAFEDEYILIAYKNKGIATIPSYCNFHSSLANFVTFYLQKQLKDFVFRAINRLDKEAEGYVVIAKDKLIYSLIKNNIQKVYTIFCYGKVLTNYIDLPIETNKKENGFNELKRVINNNGKQSKTEIIQSEYYDKQNISKCKVKIETGRTHQIRLHFASQKNPLLGDLLYGNKEKDDELKIKSLQLYCNELYLYHPILNKTIHLEKEIQNPINLE